MAMLTQTLTEASALLASVLTDTITTYTAGPPVTVGAVVTRELTEVDKAIPGLVQSTLLANAVESRTEGVYSVKVARNTTLVSGMVVEVVTCQEEPGLVGLRLLLDKVSLNGMALIRKAVGSTFEVVNQEGKGDL